MGATVGAGWGEAGREGTRSEGQRKILLVRESWMVMTLNLGESSRKTGLCQGWREKAWERDSSTLQEVSRVSSNGEPFLKCPHCKILTLILADTPWS